MEDGKVKVGEKEYVVIKTGRAQAEQVLLVSKWIANHGMSAVKALQESGKDFESENGIEFLWEIVNSLTPDALIDLYVAAIGCSQEEAEVYFDIGVLIDVVVEVYNKQPAVRRLVERFFSTPASVEAGQPE